MKPCVSSNLEQPERVQSIHKLICRKSGKTHQERVSFAKFYGGIPPDPRAEQATHRILAAPSQLVYTVALSQFLQHLNTRIIFTLLINGMVVHRMGPPLNIKFACIHSCPRAHRNNPSERLMRIQPTNHPASASVTKENEN